MKKIAGVLTAAAAALALAAPPASATETAVPAAAADAADCTTILVSEAGGWVPTAWPANPVTISYTPPATVTVDADRGVTFVSYVVLNIAGDVIAYVDCVV